MCPEARVQNKRCPCRPTSLEPFVSPVCLASLLLGKPGRVEFWSGRGPLRGLRTCPLGTPESSSHTTGHRYILLSHLGCFVSGLYLEGADWDIERGCLVKSKPKVLVVDLPILKIIPTEGHRLKLQVTVSSLAPWCLPFSRGYMRKSWRHG